MTRPDLDALGQAIGRDLARRAGRDDLIPRALWATQPTRRARLARAMRRLIRVIAAGGAS